MASREVPLETDVLIQLQMILEETGIPGISLATSRGGLRSHLHVGVADVGGFTPLSDESFFEVSCLMKFFVSLIAQRLMHRGVLNPSAPIGSYLRELSECSAGRRISVGNLFSHTSGYRGLDVTDARIKWGQSWQKLIAQLGSEELLFPPGKVFSYEHSEHVLAGEILHRLTGRTVDQLLQEEIMEP